MSFDKSKEERLNRIDHSQKAVDQKEGKPSKSDTKPIVINVYHGNLSKRSDKVSQAESSASRSFIISKKSESTEENKKHTPKNPTDSSPENSQHTLIQTYTKETQNLMSNDRKDDRSTEPRKHLCDNKSSKKARAGTELERMKLQAELKATEEIAKLKQAIIEKRLALELATIQNKVEFPSDTQCTSSHAELRALEDIMRKKQNLIETNLAQELQKLECKSRPQSSRYPPTPPSPTQRPSPPPSPNRCNNPFRTESTSSMLTNLRGLSILDKKFASDKPYTVKPTPMNIFENRYQEPRPKQMDWYQKYNIPREERESMYPVPYGVHGVPYGRGQSAWKSAMAKIKKKMRNKPPNPWEE